MVLSQSRAVNNTGFPEISLNQPSIGCCCGVIFTASWSFLYTAVNEEGCQVSPNSLTPPNQSIPPHELRLQGSQIVELVAVRLSVCLSVTV